MRRGGRFGFGIGVVVDFVVAVVVVAAAAVAGGRGGQRILSARRGVGLDRCRLLLRRH